MKVKETAKKPYGICPASMTIWNADQTYNKKGMEKYLTWLLDNGAQSISICGSTGENVAMNMEEQREIIGQCNTIFDASSGIEIFQFCNNCCSNGLFIVEVRQLQKRCIPD